MRQDVPGWLLNFPSAETETDWKGSGSHVIEQALHFAQDIGASTRIKYVGFEVEFDLTLHLHQSRSTVGSLRRASDPPGQELGRYGLNCSHKSRQGMQFGGREGEVEMSRQSYGQRTPIGTAPEVISTRTRTILPHAHKAGSRTAIRAQLFPLVSFCCLMCESSGVRAVALLGPIATERHGHLSCRA